MTLDEFRKINSKLLRKQSKKMWIMFWMIETFVFAIYMLFHLDIILCIMFGFFAGWFPCFVLLGKRPSGYISSQKFLSKIIGEEQLIGKEYEDFWDNDKEVYVTITTNTSRHSKDIETFIIDAEKGIVTDRYKKKNFY